MTLKESARSSLYWGITFMSVSWFISTGFLVFGFIVESDQTRGPMVACCVWGFGTGIYTLAIIDYLRGKVN